jgi:plasmid rolling circle replication initiator protein Rep
MKWRARFFKAIPKILETYPNARFLLLTLTQRNCELTDLKETLQDMNKAWERLSKRKQFPAIGWIKSVEVTRSLDGTAHPHFHALLMVKPSYFKKNYLSQATWTELWAKSLRIDYTPIVDVRVVKPRPGHEGDLGAGLSAALLETLKYGVKESDLVSDRDWLIELTKQLHKTRAVAIGGVLRDLIREDDPEDLIHDEDNPDSSESDDSIKFLFGWRERLEEYIYVDKDT